MKTHIIPFYIGIISVVFFHRPCFGDTLSLAKGMKLVLLKDKRNNSPPGIIVTFPDGYTDTLVLKKHYFNEEDRITAEEHCNYIGHLAIERDACVAVSGCIGLEDVDLKIMSSHSIGSSSYVWKQDGQILQVDDDIWDGDDVIYDDVIEDDAIEDEERLTRLIPEPEAGIQGMAIQVVEFSNGV